MGRGLDLNAGHKVRQLNHDQHFGQKELNNHFPATHRTVRSIHGQE